MRHSVLVGPPERPVAPGLRTLIRPRTYRGRMDSCRDEILTAAANLAARSADGTFGPDDVLREMRRRGSTYQDPRSVPTSRP